MAAARATKDGDGERRPIEAGDPGDRRRRPGRPDRAGAADPDGGRPDPRGAADPVAAGRGAGAEGAARAGHEPGACARCARPWQHRRPVLVSGGDPLFYGVARYLCDRLGKDHFEVVPHVSSMQLAFARIKESWEDAYLTSLAGRPIEAVVDRIRTAEKVGLFSSDECPPSRLARELLDRGIDYFRAYVCENLGSPDERVTQGELADLAAMDFDPLNVVILIRKPNRPDRAMLGEPAPALRQPGRRLRAVAAQARADHPGRGPGHRAGAARHPADQRRVGHRRRLGLGGDRGGAARAPGDGLRRRARAGRRRADPGQCRVVRGPQRPPGGGAAPRGPGDACPSPTPSSWAAPAGRWTRS